MLHKCLKLIHIQNVGGGLRKVKLRAALLTHFCFFCTEGSKEISRV